MPVTTGAGRLTESTHLGERLTREGIAIERVRSRRT
jgi:hypothetical protein